MTAKAKTYSDPESFIIDRAKWFRGKGQEKSKLRVVRGNDKGMMCCLGHMCLASNFSETQISGAATPSSLSERFISKNITVDWKTKLITKRHNSNNQYDSNVCLQMMNVNDNISITDKIRETKLTELFKKIGVKVKFKG